MYLGLPSLIGRKKSHLFPMLKERDRNKILCWKSKLFSCRGKEVLLKAVAQAILTYSMSVLDCLLVFVLNCRKWWLIIGGVILPRPRIFVGFSGGLFANQKEQEWVQDLIAFNQALLAK